MEPGVPGTLGIKIGASIDPVWISKSAPALGMFLSVSSDKGVYAEVRLPKRLSSANAARRIRGIVLSRYCDIEEGSSPLSYDLESRKIMAWWASSNCAWRGKGVKGQS